MLIAIVLFFLLLFWIYNSTQKAAKFPSGPPRLPVVGGLPWLINGSDGNGIQAFENLRMKYGKVFGFYIGYGKFIVLSDFALVKEAFKSEHLADRPPFKPFNEFREGHKNPGLSGSTPGLAQSNGIYWQEQRRFALRNLRDLGFGKTSMNDLLQEEAMKLCSLLGAKEDMDLDLTTMLNRSIVNAVWFIISGEKMELEDPRLNELVSLINAFGANVNLSSPLTFMLPHPSMAKLPILRSIMNFDLIKDAFESVNKYIQQTVRCHQQNSDLDNPQDFIDVYLKRMQEETNIESSFSSENGFDALVSVLADLMMPGMETVSSALSWAFYFMAKHPDVQERAYQEIKQVPYFIHFTKLSCNLLSTTFISNETMQFYNIPFCISLFSDLGRRKSTLTHR